MPVQRSRHFAKHLKSLSESVSVWMVFRPSWQMQGCAVQVLKRFEDRTIALHAKPLSNVNTKVRIDPKQVGIKRSVVQLRKRYPVLYYRLPHKLMAIRDDVSGIQQQRLWQAGQRAPSAICINHCLPE